MILIGVFVLVLVGFAMTRSEVTGGTLAGNATVVDGDTLRIGSRSVRLLGLDAPELDQDCSRLDGSEWPCGLAARAFVIALLRDGWVSCAQFGRDTYNRPLARCEAKGVDVAAAIVRAGWAVSNDRYAAQASAARSQQLGIWSGTFVQPADWRHNHGAGHSDPWQWIRSWFQ